MFLPFSTVMAGGARNQYATMASRGVDPRFVRHLRTSTEFVTRGSTRRRAALSCFPRARPELELPRRDPTRSPASSEGLPALIAALDDRARSPPPRGQPQARDRLATKRSRRSDYWPPSRTIAPLRKAHAPHWPAGLGSTACTTPPRMRSTRRISVRARLHANERVTRVLMRGLESDRPPRRGDVG
jgi:hypothetical protein